MNGIQYNLAAITNLDYFKMDEATYQDIREMIDLGWNIDTTVTWLKDIAPACKDYLLKCIWRGKLVNCIDVIYYYL